MRGHLAGTAGGWSILLCTSPPLLSQPHFLSQALTNSVAGLTAVPLKLSLNLQFFLQPASSEFTGPHAASRAAALLPLRLDYTRGFSDESWSRWWIVAAAAAAAAASGVSFPQTECFVSLLNAMSLSVCLSRGNLRGRRFIKRLLLSRPLHSVLEHQSDIHGQD